MNKKKRIIATLVGIIIGLLLLALQKQNIFTLEQLNLNKSALMNFVDEHYFFSVLIFIASYILFAALMLPGAFILSLAGGLLFGLLPGALYVVFGATIGAYCAFLATRYFFGNQVQRIYSNALKAFNQAVKEYGALYLFAVRLIPLFPFFLVNMFAGLTQISSGTFIVTTALGMLPLVIGFTFLGAQLRHTDAIHDFFTYPLAIVGLLILLPIMIATIVRRRRKGNLLIK